MTNEEASTVASFVPGDLLYGAPAIAEFLGMTERQARHRIATGQLPSFNIGKTICSRKSTIAAALQQLEQQPAPAPDPAAA